MKLVMFRLCFHPREREQTELSGSVRTHRRGARSSLVNMDLQDRGWHVVLLKMAPSRWFLPDLLVPEGGSVM